MDKCNVKENLEWAKWADSWLFLKSGELAALLPNRPHD